MHSKSMKSDVIREVRSLIEDSKHQLRDIGLLLSEVTLGLCMDLWTAPVLSRDYLEEWWVYARLIQIKDEIEEGNREDLSPDSIWDEIQSAIKLGDRDVWMGWMQKRDEEWNKIKSNS